ncbi:MAG: ABC transporter ATP-binding protein [Bacteroidota bacterium]
MLIVSNIVFSYQESIVLDHISFTLEKGSHLAIMGESGSGKSTLLKAIYGYLELKNGTIFWNDQQVLGPNHSLVLGEKQMKYVSQHLDLMPFTTVSENIIKYLPAQNKAQQYERVAELLYLIQMPDHANTKVKNLSGGQQQRVALAQALAQEPQVLLLDEPFSSIDQFKKNDLRYRLFPYLKERGITVLTATHDPNDMLSFADKVLVLKNGDLIAYESTSRLYQNPKLHYIASLFGTANKLPIKLLKEYAKLDASVVVYPHEFEISKISGVEVYIVNNHFKGSHFLVEGMAKNGQVVFFNNIHAFKIHATVYLNIPLHLVNRRMVVDH